MCSNKTAKNVRAPNPNTLIETKNPIDDNNNDDDDDDGDEDGDDHPNNNVQHWL